MIAAFEDNWLALMACIVSKKQLTSNEALEKMGIIQRSDKKQDYSDRAKLSESDLEDIKKLYYEQGLITNEIGEIYHCSGTTILNFFKAHSLKTRNRGDYHDRGNCIRSDKAVRK